MKSLAAFTVASDFIALSVTNSPERSPLHILARDVGLMIYRAVNVVILFGCVAVHAGAAEAQVNFGRDILPLLSQNCFGCHGPDEGSRKAKLRLDTHEGMLRTRNDLTVVVPGKPAE